MGKKPNFISVAYKYKVHHVLLWVMLLGYWMQRYRDFYPSLFETFLAALIFLVFISTAVYITVYRLIPRYFNKKKIILFVFYTIGIIILCTALLVLSIQKFDIVCANENAPPFTFSNTFLPLLVSVILYVFFVVAIKLLLTRFHEQNYLELLEKDRMEMEIKYLKAQMDPHFLLNSLNTIYYKIERQNTEARDILIKFADMLKYQLYNSNTEKVSIETELEYLKNYVDMQQVRLNKNYRVDFSCDENLKGFEIVPHLMLAFVENAFKHVSHFEDKQNEIKISVTKENDSLQLITMNTKELNENEVKQNGIGLTNVKRRLDLLYPESHELVINETENKYEVKLKIQVS